MKEEESKIYNTIINTEFSNYLNDTTINELLEPPKRVNVVAIEIFPETRIFSFTFVK